MKSCIRCGARKNLHIQNSWVIKSTKERRNNFICRPCNNKRCHEYRHLRGGMKKVMEAVKRWNDKMK
jgi:hypothetical protein